LGETCCPFCGDAGEHSKIASLPAIGGEMGLFACTACGTRFFPMSADIGKMSRDWESAAAIRMNFELGRVIPGTAALLSKVEAPPGARLLHLGSRFGLGVAMARHVLGWTAYGVDSGAMADEAERLFGADWLFAQDLDEYSLPDGQFDVLIVSHLLEVVENPRHLLAELRERLTPGGTLLLEVLDGAQLVSTMERGELNARATPGHIRAISTAGALRDALAASGFGAVRVEQAGLHLHVLARLLPGPLPAPPPAREQDYRRRFALALLDIQPPASWLWNGAARMAFAELAAAGELGAAYALFARIADVWRAAFALDLHQPATLVEVSAVLADAPPVLPAFPLCLATVLLTRAHLAEALPEAGPVQRLAWYRGAYTTAVMAVRELRAYAALDGALALTVALARAGMAAQLGALAPALVPELMAGLSQSSGTALDDIILPQLVFAPETLAGTFVQSLVEGRVWEATRVETALPADLGAALAAHPALLVDTLFCRGVAALNVHGAPAAARGWFEQMAAVVAAHPALAAKAALAREHIALARQQMV